MARGTRTIVSPFPTGRRVEMFVTTGQTFYPGMIVQEDQSVSLAGGRETCKYYDADADGGRPKSEVIIVTEELLRMRGGTMSDSYAAGEKFSGYVPVAGDELNLLLLNIAGTADDHVKGEVLIADDGTGKFIATTGSPETEMAVLKESITDPTSDTIAHCVWTGY